MSRPSFWNKLHIYEHKRMGKGPKWFEWKKIYQVAAIKKRAWPAFYWVYLHLMASLWPICQWLSPEERHYYAEACNSPRQDSPHIIWHINPRAKFAFCWRMLLQKVSALYLRFHPKAFQTFSVITVSLINVTLCWFGGYTLAVFQCILPDSAAQL